MAVYFVSKKSWSQLAKLAQSSNKFEKKRNWALF